MKRRQFLIGASGLMAGTSVVKAATQAGIALDARRTHVIVIGAGILGASIAYHLAKRGVSVAILEKAKPAAGATEKSFAWTTGYLKHSRPYCELILAGVMGWHQLADELPELKIQFGGTVYWGGTEETARTIRAEAAEKESYGYPTRLIEPAEIGRLLPKAAPGPVSAAAFNDIEGTLDPVATTNVLLARAQALGAKLVYPCEVTGLEQVSGSVQSIMTTSGRMTADRYVLAAGVDTMAMAQRVGVPVPLVDATGVLAHSKPLPPVLNRVIVLPDHRHCGIKQNPDGRIVTGGHFAGSTKLEPTREVGESMLARAAVYYPPLKGVELDFMTLGHAIWLKDGHPIVGSHPNCPNIYVTAMDIGVTLAPIIGQLAAIELMDGVSTTMLDPYRPTRFDAPQA